MTNELNLNELAIEAGEMESSETTAKPKRSRVKPKKTGAQIIEEIEALKVDVTQLEAAISNVEAGTIIHDLATKELLNKRQVLEDSLNTLYHFA